MSDFEIALLFGLALIGFAILVSLWWIAVRVGRLNRSLLVGMELVNTQRTLQLKAVDEHLDQLLDKVTAIEISVAALETTSETAHEDFN
jgi:hypothetical protein